MNDIRRYRPDKKEFSGAIVDGQNIVAMDIDIEKHLLYWTDDKTGWVMVPAIWTYGWTVYLYHIYYCIKKKKFNL